MTTHIHRVTVRGFFDGLDDEQVARLRAAQPDHDVLHAAFTPEGTLTYATDVAAFSFRLEVRTAGDDRDHHAAAVSIGVERAQATLRQLGLGHKDLRATAADMADVWRGTAR